MKREELITDKQHELIAAYRVSDWQLIDILEPELAQLLSLTPAVNESEKPMTAEQVLKLGDDYADLWREQSPDISDETLAQMAISYTRGYIAARQDFAASRTVAEREVSGIRKRFLDEFGHEPTSNSNRRWEGVQWYMELTKGREK